jgi:hypothetical protein
MEFRVLAENYTDRYDRRQSKPDSDGLRPDRRRWWPGETAHLAVDGAEETLCAARVSGFVLVDGVDRDDADVPWCWVCTSTAGE